MQRAPRSVDADDHATFDLQPGLLMVVASSLSILVTALSVPCALSTPSRSGPTEDLRPEGHDATGLQPLGTSSSLRRHEMVEECGYVEHQNMLRRGGHAAAVALAPIGLQRLLAPVEAGAQPAGDLPVQVLSGERSQLRKVGLHIGNKAIGIGDGGRIGVDPDVAGAGVAHHRHVHCCTDAGAERDDALDLGA